ncbi:hypothetical protein GBAR_LOCUS25670 [Geodia barretti]|uniref:Gfo/Idh/MocA-like oxidoreductase C-terminal domain-containing protein n=1 Tax=Geodia barretti TaxID=519541 RepID=A0AA35XD28_GEOBA|nr:hypothetical protein GBAR_LOCUS25670 [Geodia barretti]
MAVSELHSRVRGVSPIATRTTVLTRLRVHSHVSPRCDSRMLTCSQNVGGRVGFDYIEVMGTAGRIKSEWPSNIINVVSETVEEYRHPTLIVPPEPRAYVEKMYRDELDSWVRSVNQRTDPPITVDDGRERTRVISAVFESGKSNSPVTLR